MATRVAKTARKRGARAAERREQILDAAAQLFAEQGYSETDTDALAARLHVGKGTLYRYFPSKRELFLATADRVMKRLRQSVEMKLEGVTDCVERICVAVRGFLEFCAGHPEFVELLVQERANFKDRKKPTYFEHRENHVRRWHDLYRDLIAADRIRNVPVERISDVISNQLYGTLFTNYFAGTAKPWQRQAEDVLDIVFHGILSSSERKRRGIV